MFLPAGRLVVRSVDAYPSVEYQKLKNGPRKIGSGVLRSREQGDTARQASEGLVQRFLAADSRVSVAVEAVVHYSTRPGNGRISTVYGGRRRQSRARGC